ncbi:hypothetical protein HDU96_001602 [Phlyctochytrium bullatum]|nr:hypothetical protein HDU96_001602 [Phlyctochytrium bullatum]
MTVAYNSPAPSADDRSVASLHRFISRENPERPVIIGQGKTIPVENQPNIVLRESVPSDYEPLSNFNGFCHAGNDQDDIFGGYTRIWLKEADNNDPARHPVIDHRMILVAVDLSISPNDAEKVAALSEQDRRFLAHDGLIVSSTMGIPQVWVYGDPEGVRIPLVGYRVEAVATHPNYRSRNLLQPQFDLHHLYAEKLSSDFCMITGLKGFYRKFGYDLAPRLQILGAYLSHVPQLQGSKDRFPVPVTSSAAISDEGNVKSLEDVPSNLGSLFHLGKTSWGLAEGEPYVIRRATLSDVPFLTRASRLTNSSRKHVASDADEAWWSNMVAGRELDDWPAAFQRRDIFVIEEALDAQPEAASGAEAPEPRVGLLQISAHGWPLNIHKLELDPSRSDHSWTSVAPTVMRWYAYAALERERDNVRLRNARKLQKLAKEPPAAEAAPADADKPASQASAELAPLPTALKPDYVFKFWVSQKHHPFLRSLGNPALTFPVLLTDHALYTRINSFPRLLRRLVPLFNARLARHTVFRGFTGTLVLFSTPGDVAKNGGAVVRIRRGAVAEIVVPGVDDAAPDTKPSKKKFEEVIGAEEKVLKEYQAANSRSAAAPSAPVTVFCPQGNALMFVQVVMGMTGAVELLKRYPGDVWATKDGLAAMVLDVMFDTEREGSMNAEEVWTLD